MEPIAIITQNTLSKSYKKSFLNIYKPKICGYVQTKNCLWFWLSIGIILKDAWNIKIINFHSRIWVFKLKLFQCPFMDDFLQFWPSVHRMLAVVALSNWYINSDQLDYWTLLNRKIGFRVNLIFHQISISISSPALYER